VTIFLIVAGFITGYYMPLAGAVPYPARVIVVIGVGCSVPMIGVLLTRRMSTYFLIGMSTILAGTIYLIAAWWPETAAQYSSLVSHLSGLLFFLLGRTPLIAFLVVLFVYVLNSFVDVMLGHDQSVASDGDSGQIGIEHACTFIFSGVAVFAAYLFWEFILWLCDRFWVRGYYGITFSVMPALWVGAVSCLLCLGAFVVGTPVCKQLLISDSNSSDLVDSFMDTHVASWLGQRWAGVPFLVVGCGLVGLACWIGYALLDDAWWEVPASLITMFWQVPMTLVDLFLHPVNLGSIVLDATVGPCLAVGGAVFGIGVLLFATNHMDKGQSGEESQSQV